MKAPDTIDEVYAEVIEQYSEKRQDEMKKLVNILARTDASDVSPDKHFDPLDPSDDSGQSEFGYINPFTIAKFTSWKGFCNGFPSYVTDMLSYMVDRAKEANLIDGIEAKRLTDAMAEWLPKACEIVCSIEECAIASNCDFVLFCTKARITDMFQRGDLVFKDGVFHKDYIEASLVAVELDLEVINRLIKSPVTNEMFGGEVIVVRKGREKTLKTTSIADLL